MALLKTLILLLFFICNYSTGKKHEKINDCVRCKVLTDSFKHWIDKTSRGKFEGGDAAWEEAKLKSYSRSEIRLVEVQEGLCSDLKKNKDECYALAEETETIIEKWWFEEQHHSNDLFSWLCLDTLQYCCPDNHFGVSCDPCPTDSAQTVCGGHGKCDGDGTRQGNGTCLCNQGYSGTLCELCEKNYYSVNSQCKACHKSCLECNSYGADSCEKCKPGWEMISGFCKDINECLDSLICSDNKFCVNNEGSYTCKLCHNSCKMCVGADSTDCSLCQSGSVLWGGKCVDDALKSEMLRSSLIKVAQYFGLLAIAMFVFRHSKILTSVTVAIVAINIYFSEKSAEIKVLEVFLNLYLN